MKKKNTDTKVTVKLRKAENEELWYLYLECYPVYQEGDDNPQRVRVYLNRAIRTPKWDKSKKTRPTNGKQNYKPLRDLNGIILCKSELDNENCIYADERRKLLQNECNTLNLHSEQDKEKAEFELKSKENFLDFFQRTIKKRHGNGSSSIITNWKRVGELIKIYAGKETIPFHQINEGFIDGFKYFMLSAPQGGGKSGPVSHNTASTYFSIFLASLKQAFIEGYFRTDIAAKTKGIKSLESRREYLTQEELDTLAQTECDMPILKRAALFSALTGLRHCDIQKLTWAEVQKDGNKYSLNFTQQKTKGVEYMPISQQAYSLCGESQDPDRLVFEDLPDAAWISDPLKRWIKAAGITRNITFHCFRHTFATLQLANGTDIYTVSKMLGHKSVKTTQIYAKVINKSKEKAANNIHISEINI